MSAVEVGAGRDGTQPGVIIQWGDPSSAAGAAGLHPGDVIAGVNIREVHTPEEITAAPAETQNSPLLLRVFRGGHAVFLVVA